MSIEAKIDALIAALTTNTAALVASTGKKLDAAPEKPAGKAADKGEKPTTGIDYDRDVKAHVVELGKSKGRDAVLGVIGAFKTKAGAPAANALEVDPKDWPKLSEALKAKIAEPAALA